MGSPDDVGAVHQVLDEAVEDDMIVDYDVPVGGYAMYDIILRLRRVFLRA